MTTPIACDPSAIAEKDRAHWLDVAKRVHAAVQEVQDLPEGYAFRFAASTDELVALAVHVDFERRCCPFLRFAIEVEAEHGPVWLRVTGGEGVKEFLRATIGSVV